MTTSPPGVFFQCQRCGNCCRWPGDVNVEADECSAIAAYLGIAEDEFLASYTRLRTHRNGLSLIEKPNDECIFLENGACSIQAVKPSQCRGFPNKWNFKGWQDHCEAIPLAVPLHLGQSSMPLPPASSALPPEKKSKPMQLKKRSKRATP